MLKFFRRIRKQLLKENRVTRYLVYAFGEVILVVIGILIALQINNWNEQKKIDAQELKLLNGLHYTLTQHDWNFILNSNEACNISTDIILKKIKSDEKYHDSLDTHFSRAFYTYSEDLDKTAYETAKVYGLNFIKNDTTKMKLSRLYEVEENILNKFVQRSEDFNTYTLSPFLSMHFERFNYDDRTILRPINFDQLKTNKTFEYILKTKERNRYNQVNWQKSILGKIDEVKLLLEKEINYYN